MSDNKPAGPVNTHDYHAEQRAVEETTKRSITLQAQQARELARAKQGINDPELAHDLALQEEAGRRVSNVNAVVKAGAVQILTGTDPKNRQAEDTTAALNFQIATGASDRSGHHHG